MRMSIRLLLLAAALLVASPTWALSLNQAMGALPEAKAAGLLGERPDGYVGVVSPGGDAAEIARLINEARRAEYQRLAAENGIKLRDVEAIAGKKALERTPSGQYIQLNGVWMPK
ncbi:YdbL family protein [Halopseudomonas salina]|uniref:DUF1318 domain-containing protein n=1 Tax=Halopseudomonas salina TaxID=1323744 RepID=A0ABQ1P7M8_9GAMM|nr:YdbL family protein [Halopseudomonas salina]GGC92737.1 hypothetical protein GCM10007418_10320 [Halopseudomonas salina]